MALHENTKELMKFLKQNPDIRGRIKAQPNKTLLYAGHIIKPAWKEIADRKMTHGAAFDKTILPEVLETIEAPGYPYENLLDWAKKLDELRPWELNGYLVWRALSGLFAANAVGAVSFMIGSGVSRDNKKVFAVTEIRVLDRNPNVDNVTKDVIQYYLRCIERKQSDINTSLIHG